MSHSREVAGGSFAFYEYDMEIIKPNCHNHFSRYFNAALTIIEKPKRKNDPAIIVRDSASEPCLPNSDNMPPKRHITPIIPMALGTMLLNLRSFSFCSNSSYLSNPDLGFSSIVTNFYCKVKQLFGMKQPAYAII